MHMPGRESVDDVDFGEAVRLRRVSVVPYGKRPLADFVSKTQEHSFELEMFYEASDGDPNPPSVATVDDDMGKCPLGMGRLSPYFKAKGGVTYNLPRDVQTTRLTLRGNYTMLSMCFYGVLDDDEQDPVEVRWTPLWQGWPKLPESAAKTEATAPSEEQGEVGNGMGIAERDEDDEEDPTSNAFDEKKDPLASEHESSQSVREAWERAGTEGLENPSEALQEAVEETEKDGSGKNIPEAAIQTLATCLATRKKSRAVRKHILLAAAAVYSHGSRPPSSPPNGLVECCREVLEDRSASPRTVEAVGNILGAASTRSLDEWRDCLEGAWRRFAKPRDFYCAPCETLREKLRSFVELSVLKRSLETLGSASCAIVRSTASGEDEASCWPAVREAGRAAEACAALFDDTFHDKELVYASVGCAACAVAALPTSKALWIPTRQLLIKALLSKTATTKNDRRRRRCSKRVARVLEDTPKEGPDYAATSLLPLDQETRRGIARAISRRLEMSSIIARLAAIETRKRMALPGGNDDETLDLLDRAYREKSDAAFLFEDEDARHAVLRSENKQLASALTKEAWLSGELSLLARRSIEDAVMLTSTGFLEPPPLKKRRVVEDEPFDQVRRIVEATREIWEDDDALVAACASSEDDESALGWALLLKKLEASDGGEVLVYKVLEKRLMDCPRRLDQPYSRSALGALETATRAVRSLRLKHPFDHISDPSLSTPLAHKPPAAELVRYFQMRVDAPLYENEDDDEATNLDKQKEKLDDVSRKMLSALRAAKVANWLLKRVVDPAERWRDSDDGTACCMRLLTELSFAFPQPLTQTERDDGESGSAAASLLGETYGTTSLSLLASALAFETTSLLASHVPPRTLVRNVLEHARSNVRNRLAALRTLRAVLPSHRSPAPVVGIAAKVVEPIDRRKLSDDDCAKRAALAAVLDPSKFPEAADAAEKALAEHRNVWRDALDTAAAEPNFSLRLIVSCCQSASGLIRSSAADVACRVLDLGGRASIVFAGLLSYELRNAVTAARRQQQQSAAPKDTGGASSNSKEPTSFFNEWARVGRLLVCVRELCALGLASKVVYASGLALALIEALGVAKPEVLRLAMESIALLINQNAREEHHSLARNFSADAYMIAPSVDDSLSQMCMEALTRSLHRVLTKYHRADLHVHAAAARCFVLLARADNQDSPIAPSASRVLRILETKGAIKKALSSLAAGALVANDGDDDGWKLARGLRAAAWLAHIPAALAFDAGLDAKRIANLVDEKSVEALRSALAVLEERNLDSGSLPASYLPVADRTSSELVDLRQQLVLEARREVMTDQAAACSDSELAIAVRKRADFLVELAFSGGTRHNIVLGPWQPRPVSAYNPMLLAQSRRIVCGLYDEDEPPPCRKTLSNYSQSELVQVSGHRDGVLKLVEAAETSQLWDAEDGARSLTTTALTDVPLEATRQALSQILATAADDAVRSETKRLSARRRAKVKNPDLDPFDASTVQPSENALPEDKTSEREELPVPPLPVPSDPRQRRFLGEDQRPQSPTPQGFSAGGNNAASSHPGVAWAPPLPPQGSAPPFPPPFLRGPPPPSLPIHNRVGGPPPPQSRMDERGPPGKMSIGLPIALPNQSPRPPPLPPAPQGSGFSAAPLPPVASGFGPSPGARSGFSDPRPPPSNNGLPLALPIPPVQQQPLQAPVSPPATGPPASRAVDPRRRKRQQAS